MVSRGIKICQKILGVTNWYHDSRVINSFKGIKDKQCIKANSSVQTCYGNVKDMLEYSKDMLGTKTIFPGIC